MLGERATTEIHLVENSQGVPKLQSDAKAGGSIAGGAQKETRKKIETFDRFERKLSDKAAEQEVVEEID